MQSNFLKAAFYLMLVLNATTTACKKEKQADNSSPAYNIGESEKIVLPTAINFPANTNGHQRIATFYAKGVQKYKAQLKAGSTGQYEWVFVAPQADLYDVQNKKVGAHGAGPYWTLSNNDSLFAQAFVPAKASPSPDPNAIDWLLLMTRQGKVPTGIFTNVAYVHRIATKGGKAPVAAPADITQTIEVPYTAVYRFSQKNP